MATNFGKTWWGEQWLNALINIDYEDRLARGKSYANKILAEMTVSTGENWIGNLSNKELKDLFAI